MESNFYCARKNVTASKGIYSYFVCSTPPTPLHALRSHHSMIFISPAFFCVLCYFSFGCFLLPRPFGNGQVLLLLSLVFALFSRLLLRATRGGFEDDAAELSCDDEAARGGGGLESNEITFQLLTCHSPRKHVVGAGSLFSAEWKVSAAKIFREDRGIHFETNRKVS